MSKKIEEAIEKLVESEHCRYEVRFPENPDPTFSQSFIYRHEADEFMQDFPGAELYLVCDPEFCNNEEVAAHNYEIPLVGAEADRLAREYDENTPNWFDSDMDATKYTDENGEFPRDEHGEFRAPVFEDDLDDEEDLVSSESDIDEEEFSAEELGEALFSALQEKRCKTHDVITHAEDELATLKEEADC